MTTAASCKNNLFAKYGHDCELGSTRDELPMYKTGGNVCAQIKNKLRRSTMAADDNQRALKFFKSQRKIDIERLNHLVHKRMLHPFSDIRRWWETVMVFVFIAIFVVIPLDLASYNFPLKHNLNNVVLWKILRLFLDVICCLDVIINFCTGYIDFKSKRIVMEPKKIAMRYGFTYFIPDLISSIPTHLDLFSKTGNFEIVFAILQNTAVLKVFRFVTFLRYCKHTREVHNFNYVKSRVILSMFCYVLYFHILTCVGLMVIGMTTEEKKKIQQGFKKDVYVWAIDGCEFDFFGAYFRVLRSVSYVATFSFSSSILSKHMPQLGLIFIWMLSKIIYFFLITQLMELVISSRSSSRKYLEMVRELKEYMGHKQLPISLQNRLLSYYNFKFQKSYFRESEILSVITGQLKQDLVMHSCRKLVEHVGFFQNLPLQLIVRIVSALTIEIYMVNDVIIKAGTRGTCMYFIATGCVAIYTKMGFEVRHLEDGEYFGEYSLLKHTMRESSVVATETCELYRLGYEDFNKVIMSYPDLIDKITKHAVDRIEMTSYVEERFCRKKTMAR